MSRFNLREIQTLFLFVFFLLPACSSSKEGGQIMTVKGFIPSGSGGAFLTHEHILVDFIGADSIRSDRWNREKVIRKTLPYLLEAKERGCRTFVDCTPDYLGRDVVLLQELSKLSDVNILTNTGFYGAANNKYIPEFAFAETAEQLAARWIGEWKNGIGRSGIRPGFIKIGVNDGNLSEMDIKLISAAAKTHLQTGLVIASHTGLSIPAFEQIAVLKKEGVSPEAFIWVHAQAEKDSRKHVEAALLGTWISLDGLSDDNVTDYVGMIKVLKEAGLLHKVLLSHDAGWYDPAQPDGGRIRGFSTLFEKLIPALQDNGFTQEEVKLLLEENPAKAFEIKIRKR